MAAEPKGAALKTVQAAVARGHTITAGDAGREYGPGEIVELSVEDSRRLTALGFLSDPGAPALPMGAGPVFGEERSMISHPDGDGR